MMFQPTLQDVTYPDYPIQYPSSPSTGIEEMDIRDFLINILSNLTRQNIKRPSYLSLISVLDSDLSSIWPRFEIKSETSLTRELTKKKVPEVISEEDIAMEMLEHDFVVKMSPRRKYKIHVSVKSRRKGKPKAVEFDNDLFAE